VSARQVCSSAPPRPGRLSARIVDALFTAYGIDGSARARYRIDRLIGVRLGGSSVRPNLWPQRRSGQLSARHKDRAEAYLLTQVCRGNLSLRHAQTKLARNWVAVYRALPRSRPRPQPKRAGA